MRNYKKYQENEGNYEYPSYEGNIFWSKVKKILRKVPFVPDAIAMYFCFIDSSTPLSARGTALLALAYFVFPIDALPDVIPVAGYVDDGAAISAAVSAIAPYITDEHRSKTKDFLDSKI